MTYPPPPPPRRSSPLGVILGIGLILVVAAGAYAFMRSGGGEAVLNRVPAAIAPRAIVSADMVARELERDPQSRAVVAAFRETFPAEWTALTTEMATRVRAGATADELRRYGFDTMRNFATTRAASLAAAPDAELRQVTVTQLALAQSLQTVNPAMCARFTASGFSAEDMAAFPPTSQAALDSAVRAQLVATRAGMDRAVARPQPTPAEIQSFLQAYQQAGGELSFLEQAGRGVAGDGVDACRSGVAVYQAVANLPPEAGARVMSFIVTQAAAAQGGAAASPAAPAGAK